MKDNKLKNCYIDDRIDNNLEMLDIECEPKINNSIYDKIFVNHHFSYKFVQFY